MEVCDKDREEGKKIPVEATCGVAANERRVIPGPTLELKAKAHFLQNPNEGFEFCESMPQ
jgi:hypothetical protein